MIDAPCRDCLAGCCRGYAVEITGFDAWRIARGLAVAFQDFVELRYTETSDAQHRVILDGDVHCRMILKRVPEPREERLLPLRCVFLVDVGEVSRCGVASLRPSVCRSYPFHGEPPTTDGSGQFCPEGAWAKVPDGVRARLAFKQRQWAIYHRLIDRWNLGSARTQPRYYEFLAKAYADLERRHPEWFEANDLEPNLDEI